MKTTQLTDADDQILVTAAPVGEPGEGPVLDPSHPRQRCRCSSAARRAVAVGMLLALVLAGCGSGGSGSTGGSARAATGKNTAATTSTTPPTTSATTTTPAILPGTGRPTVTIGDKNFTEQFILGELYAQALTAQGFTVDLNKNIGSTEITLLALQDGQLDMYPEYLGSFNVNVANDSAVFPTAQAAFVAAQRFATAHGAQLLRPTPFSDTDAIAVTAAYAAVNHLGAISDLSRVQSSLTLGAPPQFQTNQAGLPGLQSAYGVTPAQFEPLAIGDQYQALQDGSVQAADVFTTDGELSSGQYQLLQDPAHVFGFGNVVPVVTQSALLAEGPAFAQIINRVSATLTTQTMRLLNADVNLYNETPGYVARQFLIAHGLLPGAAP